MRMRVIPGLLVPLLVSCFVLAQRADPPAAPDDSAPAPSVAPTVARPEASQPSPELTPDAGGIISQEQARELIRLVAEKDVENDKKQRDYTYIQREEENTLDGKGQIKKTETRTREILMVYGEQIERLIAKDDKPLSPKDAAKEEERIQKLIEKRKNESERDRQKRLKQEEKDREEGRAFVREIADAYNFRLVGIEPVEGRETYVLDADPRPGFQPKKKEARLLTKIRGRIWIDKAERQWVKIDAQVIDTISFGLFLARLHKGTRIVAEQTRINDEVWLPKHEAAKVDVRVALLKNFNVDEDVTYRDYKKFHTDTKIVGVGEIQESER